MRNRKVLYGALQNYFKLSSCVLYFICIDSINWQNVVIILLYCDPLSLVIRRCHWIKM